MRVAWTIFAACALIAPLAANASDHGSASVVDGADLTDLYAWMTPDGSRLNLVANLTTTSTAPAFTEVVYVFHIGSGATLGDQVEETTVQCAFEADRTLHCWAGLDEYAAGDPAVSPDGIDSDSGDLRIWSGYRSDPFYWNQAGFVAAVGQAQTASAAADHRGCKRLDPSRTASIASQLTSGGVNALAGNKVVTLAVQVHRSVITRGGSVVAVWASTHVRETEL